MDLADMNREGRDLKWVPPRRPQVDGLVVARVEATQR